MERGQPWELQQVRQLGLEQRRRVAAGTSSCPRRRLAWRQGSGRCRSSRVHGDGSSCHCAGSPRAAGGTHRRCRLGCGSRHCLGSHRGRQSSLAPRSTVAAVAHHQSSRPSENQSLGRRSSRPWEHRCRSCQPRFGLPCHCRHLDRRSPGGSRCCCRGRGRTGRVDGKSRGRTGRADGKRKSQTEIFCLGIDLYF